MPIVGNITIVITAIVGTYLISKLRSQQILRFYSDKKIVMS